VKLLNFHVVFIILDFLTFDSKLSVCFSFELNNLLRRMLLLFVDFLYWRLPEAVELIC